jgi:hypothetical protein
MLWLCLCLCCLLFVVFDVILLDFVCFVVVLTCSFRLEHESQNSLSRDELSRVLKPLELALSSPVLGDSVATHILAMLYENKGLSEDLQRSKKTKKM